jgi:hypothetical protein
VDLTKVSPYERDIENLVVAYDQKDMAAKGAFKNEEQKCKLQRGGEGIAIIIVRACRGENHLNPGFVPPKRGQVQSIHPRKSECLH